MKGPIAGISLFTRDSGGGLGLIAYHPRHSGTWYWSVGIIRSPVFRRWWLVSRAPRRTHQWHDYYRLPFGKALSISRQDYHKRGQPPDEPDESIYGPADQIIGLIAWLVLIAAVVVVAVWL